MNKIYKIFSEHLFQRTGLGTPSDIYWGVIFRRDGDLDSSLDPVYLQWNHSLTWLGQFKQKFL